MAHQKIYFEDAMKKFAVSQPLFDFVQIAMFSEVDLLGVYVNLIRQIDRAENEVEKKKYLKLEDELRDVLIPPQTEGVRLVPRKKRKRTMAKK
jgi:hypothetical protein